MSYARAYDALPSGAVGLFQPGSLTSVQNLSRGPSAFTLGPELFTDAGLETWTSPTDLTHWVEETSMGSSTVNQETVDMVEGLSSVRFDGDVTGAHAGIYQLGKVLTIGRRYRFSFWYKSDSGAQGRIWIYGGPAYEVALNEGSIWSTNLTGIRWIDLPSNTSWAQYFVDFYPYSLYDTYLLSVSTGYGCASKSIYYDALSFKEVIPTTPIAPKQVNFTAPSTIETIGWKFDGTDDYITSNILPPQGPISVGFWFNRPINTAIAPALHFANGIGTTPVFSIRGGLNAPLVWLGSDNYRYWSPSTPVDTTLVNKWYYIVFTVPGAAQADITNAVCYVNGQVQTSSTTAFTTAQSSRTTIGLGRTATASYLNSRIALPTIFNRVLTASEVLNIYNAQKHLFSPR